MSNPTNSKSKAIKTKLANLINTLPRDICIKTRITNWSFDLQKYFKGVNIDNLYYLNRLIGIYNAWLDEEQKPCNNYNDGSDKAVLSREYGSVNNFFRMLEQKILFIQDDE